jgi:threonyl-tRNA synthetase
MRLLFVHADRFAFEARDPTGETADTGTAAAAGSCEECVVVFVTVETADETAIDRAVAGARAEIEDVADQLRTTTLVLYPSTHLSGSIAAPGCTADALQALAASLHGDYDVLRAPSGQYRSFELAAKGHPHAERSRRVTVGKDRTAADSDGTPPSDPERSEWAVAFPGGDVRPAGEAIGRVDAAMQTLVDGGSDAGTRNGYPDAARESGLVADTGDPGTARPQLTPRGTFVRDSLVAYVREEALSAGAVPVETPGLLAPGATVRSGARPGLLSFLGDRGLDRGDLPVAVYQQAIDAVLPGDASGADRADLNGGERRIESRTVPELWTIAADRESAREVFVEQAQLARRLTGSLALDPCYRLRASREFQERNGAWIERLAGALDGPVLVERPPGGGDPAPVELAFVTIGRQGRQTETASIRLDVESAARFDVGTDGGGADDGGTDETGTLSVVRCAPIRSVERAIAALTARAGERDPPRLPVWLAPTQVRLLPLDPGGTGEFCDDLADELETAGIRVEVDDRETTVGERFDRAETDWVPYYAAVGRAERTAGVLDVTVRSERTEVELSVADLCDRVRADTGRRPRKRSYLPRYLSEHLAGGPGENRHA